MKKIKKFIDQEKWLNRLQEEYDNTENKQRKTYLSIWMNAIACQPTVAFEVEDI